LPRADAVDRALDRVGLTTVAGRQVKAYSQGMRQRLGLAVALLRDPTLLLLDEPTNGMDPGGIRELRSLLRSLADGGTTVFLSSHLLVRSSRCATGRGAARRPARPAGPRRRADRGRGTGGGVPLSDGRYDGRRAGLVDRARACETVSAGMRLLRAELRKLNRPLLWGVLASSALFCVLLAVGGSSNARLDARGGGDARTAAQLDPVAAGAEAAGLMASLPGALAIALLAGGHAGGEWSGRTLRNLLVQHGRRWQALGAKLVSLWIAGVALIAACWAALAVAGPVLARANRLPDPHQSLGEAARWAGSQVGRSLLVVAVFGMVGLLAAVLTRNTIGTMAATAWAFVTMLAVSGLPGGGAWTPATWVRGWMGSPPARARSPTCRATSGRGSSTPPAPPGHLLGLAGLTAMLVTCGAVAWSRSSAAT
jgi:hypothetical protein